MDEEAKIRIEEPKQILLYSENGPEDWPVDACFDEMKKELVPVLAKMPKTIENLGNRLEGLSIWAEPKGDSYAVRLVLWDTRGSVGQTFIASFE